MTRPSRNPAGRPRAFEDPVTAEITMERRHLAAIDARRRGRPRGVAIGEIVDLVAEAGNRDHLPAVMAEVEPVELDRPLVMVGAVEPTEAPCLTCRYATTRADRNACRMVFDSGVWHYRVYSGALVSDDGLPTDRTMRCPGWAAKETT